MNSRRFLSALLLSSAVTLSVPAQDQAELAALRAKAEKGNGIAQYNLGLAHTRGGEVPADPLEAYVWLSLAQENGARGRALETLVATLDQPTLAAAQQRLAERRAQLATPAPTAASATPVSLAPAAPATAAEAAPADATTARLRAERDALAAKLPDLAAEIATLRSERDRLGKLVADHEQATTTAAAELAAARQLAQTADTAARRLADEKAALEQQLRSAQTSRAVSDGRAEPAAAAPTYPDLSSRVRELEAQLVSASRVATPAYPDLTARVRELETQLAEARAQLATAPTAAAVAAAPTETVDVEALQKKLAETEDKLATALRGFSFMQRQADEKAAAAQKSTEEIAAEKTTLSTRLTDIETEAAAAKAEVARLTAEAAELRRTSEQAVADLAAERAVTRQLRGANTTLANENYALKARLAPDPAAPSGSASAPASGRTHVVAEGDSLSKIAQQYYGDAKRWPEIYNANRERFGNDTKLRVGLELRIP